MCVCVQNEVASYLKVKPSFIVFYYCPIHSSYNGISSLPPLELWRFPSLKALFLQGVLMPEILNQSVQTSMSGYNVVINPVGFILFQAMS